MFSCSPRQPELNDRFSFSDFNLTFGSRYGIIRSWTVPTTNYMFKDLSSFANIKKTPNMGIFDVKNLALKVICILLPRER